MVWDVRNPCDCPGQSTHLSCTRFFLSSCLRSLRVPRTPNVPALKPCNEASLLFLICRKGVNLLFLSFWSKKGKFFLPDPGVLSSCPDCGFKGGTLRPASPLRSPYPFALPTHLRLNYPSPPFSAVHFGCSHVAFCLHCCPAWKETVTPLSSPESQGNCLMKRHQGPTNPGSSWLCTGIKMFCF